MSPIHFLAILAANFLFIGSKAAQQINVVRGYFYSVPLTSTLLALCEVTIVGSIAQQAVSGSWIDLILTAFAMALGGSFGAISVMLFYKWRQK